MRAHYAVEAEALVKTYPPDIQAVRDVTFQVAPGEAFGLLGPNGAGKTTTIGMLNTSVTPTSGHARLGGLDVARHPIGTRALSSVVFQDAVVDLPLTGRQNLELHAKLYGVPRDLAASRMSELSSTVDIADILDRPVATYSGGQRRRMEIVRALLSSPQVLFLDEPTVGLDTTIRHGLFDVITRLRERAGVTIIMTTHYLDEAEKLCDRLAVIDKGRLVACDTPARLLTSMGDVVVELRVDSPDEVTNELERHGISGGAILAVGSTLVVALEGHPSSEELINILDSAGLHPVSSTVRRPTLDDVYLRLTGSQIAAAN